MRYSALTLVVWYGVTRLLLFLAGARMSLHPPELDPIWQLLAPQWLMDDFWQSLLYLHSQPPLYNLLYGLALHVGQAQHTLLLQAVFYGLSALFLVSSYRLLLFFGLSRPLAFLLPLLFTVTPTFILYEHWFFYSHIMLTLLPSAFAWLILYAQERRIGLAVFGLSLMALMSLTRSTYHVLWVATVTLVIVSVYPPPRRRLRWVLLVPLLIVLAVYAKNVALFGQFTTSSWLGANLYKTVIFGVAPEDVAALHAAGRLTFDADQPAPFAPETIIAFDAYEREPRLEVIPATGEMFKFDGFVNYNHYKMIAYAQARGDDALTLLRECPACYGGTLLAKGFFFIQPARDYVYIEDSPLGERLRGLIEAFDRSWLGHGLGLLLFDDFKINQRPAGSFFYIPFFVFLVLAYVSGAQVSWRAFRQRDPARYAIALSYLSLLLFSLIYLLLEHGENNRFRYELEALLLLFFVIGLHQAWRGGRRQPVAPETEPMLYSDKT